MKKHISVTQEAGRQFYQNYHGKGPVVMLNLLKFREKADYTGVENLKPDKEISGKDAYKLYMKYTQPAICLLYTSPSPRDGLLSRMPSSA